MAEELDKVLLKVAGISEEQLKVQRETKKALDDAQAKQNEIADKLGEAGIDAKKNTHWLEAQTKLEKDRAIFDKKTANEQDRLKLLDKGTPLDAMAKEMGSKTFDGIKKFLGMTTLFLGGVLIVLKLLQNPKFREGVMGFFNGVKTVFETLGSFWDAVKEDIKGLPMVGVTLAAAYKRLLEPITKFATKIGTYIDDGVRAVSKMFGAGGGVPGSKGGIGIKSLLGKLRNIFRPITAFAGTLAKLPIVSSVTKFFATGGGLFKMLGKLFLPLTIIIAIWDTIKGAFDGYTESTESTWTGKIIDAIGGGIKGLVNSLVGIPLDFLKSALGWLLGKMGFTGAEEALKKFSFVEEITKIIDFYFGIIKKTVEWIKELFTDPKKALTKLWTGLMGEGGLIDILWGVVEGAIGWIKEIFPSWETVKTGILAVLKFGTPAGWLYMLITGPLKGAMTWIKEIFPDWETVKAGILTLVTFGTPAGWLYLLITGPLKGAFDWIKSLFPSWDDISQLVKDGIGFVGEAGDWLKGIIMKPIKGVMTWIKGLFPSWEDMKEKFMSDLGMLQEGASWLLGIIAKPFKGIFDFIMKIFDFDFMGMIKGIMPTKLFKWMFGKKEDNLAQEIQDQIAHEKEQIAGGDTKGGVVGWRYERDERLIELEAQLAELSQNGKTGTTNIVTVDNAPKTVSTTSTSSSYSTQKGTTPPDITQKNVAMTMRGM